MDIESQHRHAEGACPAGAGGLVGQRDAGGGWARWSALAISPSRLLPVQLIDRASAFSQDLTGNWIELSER